MTRLIRSELLKLRTTHTWWIFALVTLVFTALAFWINSLQAHQQLHSSFTMGEPPPDLSESERAQFEQMQQEEARRQAQVRTAAGLAKVAANIYTSGQFFGLMFVMLLAILLITNEYYHQTATATFLATPQRTRVITGKLITAALIGFVFWLFTTALVIPAGALYFDSEGVANSLGEWGAQRAILLNLLAYMLWAIFGIGLGVLIRSQLGATITAAVVYVLGTYASLIILQVIYVEVFDQKADWVMQSAVLIPPLASQHMIGTLEQQFPPDIHLWPRWTGAAVLIGWAVVAGTIGTLVTRKRDVA